MHFKEIVNNSTYRMLERLGIPENIKTWLLDQGSLTKRLQKACEHRFSVKVLKQRYGLPYSHEQKILGLDMGRWCFIRQVHLYCNQTPVVYARTVIPIYNLTGSESHLTRLGSSPLGARLFSDKRMGRDNMQIARITRDQSMFSDAIINIDAQFDIIWGRRSVFYLNRKKLLVTEVFLPSIGDL